MTHKAVSLGSAGVPIGDDDGLEDLAVALEVAPQPLALGLPREPPDEHLRPGGVAEGRVQVVERRGGPRPRPRPGVRRHRRGPRVHAQRQTLEELELERGKGARQEED